MSLRSIHLAAKIENTDDFHIARLLLLLNAAGGRSAKPMKGIMKLAKMDFLLRYPNCLVKALYSFGKYKELQTISEAERNTIEARMIRFRFGPWDKRYRRWISLMVSRGLANTYLDGKTVNVKLTDNGREIAFHLADLPEFESLSVRSHLVSTIVGNYSATKLKNYIYELFPEIIGMRWGKEIEL
jgi:hypothetical protein